VRKTVEAQAAAGNKREHRIYIGRLLVEAPRKFRRMRASPRSGSAMVYIELTMALALSSRGRGTRLPRTTIWPIEFDVKWAISVGEG